MGGEEEEEIELTPEEVLQEFDAMYRDDPKLRALLGESPDQHYSLEEKSSIVIAYKRGGGVDGLADIIEDVDDEQDPIHLQMLQQY